MYSAIAPAQRLAKKRAKAGSCSGCQTTVERVCSPMLQSVLPHRLSESFVRFWSHRLERAASHLETIVAKALHRAPAAESPLLAWPVACGSAVAERTRAARFSDGILRVEVADAGWRRELSSLAPRYVAAINKYSAIQVQRIEFVVKAVNLRRRQWCRVPCSVPQAAALIPRNAPRSAARP